MHRSPVRAPDPAPEHAWSCETLARARAGGRAARRVTRVTACLAGLVAADIALLALVNRILAAESIPTRVPWPDWDWLAALHLAVSGWVAAAALAATVAYFWPPDRCATHTCPAGQRGPHLLTADAAWLAGAIWSPQTVVEPAGPGGRAVGWISARVGAYRYLRPEHATSPRALTLGLPATAPLIWGPAPAGPLLEHHDHQQLSDRVAAQRVVEPR